MSEPSSTQPGAHHQTRPRLQRVAVTLKDDTLWFRYQLDRRVPKGHSTFTLNVLVATDREPWELQFGLTISSGRAIRRFVTNRSTQQLIEFELDEVRQRSNIVAVPYPLSSLANMKRPLRFSSTLSYDDAASQFGAPVNVLAQL